MHGGEVIPIMVAIASVVIGTILAPIVSLMVGSVMFRRHGWEKFLLFTLLTIIPMAIVSSIAVFLLLCIFGYAMHPITSDEALEPLMGGFDIAAWALIVSVPFALLVYVWTLFYGWIPAMLLKTKRHVIWILPLLSTSPLLAFLWWCHSLDDEDISLTWMHAVLVVVCLVGAFLSGLTITGCSRLANACLIRKREPHKLHTDGDSG